MSAKSDAKKPKFPLPRGYFGEIEFNKQQHHYYQEFCENQVRRGLLDERLHVQHQKRIDVNKWKPVRSQHNFQLYRRRDGGLHENDGKPSMLGVGRVEGSIEDVLYGAYDQTDEELRMTAELVEVDYGDGIVLSNMEQGSPSDPYRYLGIKWILTPFPMPALMPDRDWILLESMGISKDAEGRRYGYHTLYTVELPQCPPFPEVIRGTMWYTFIYRDAGRGMIDVHSQGYFDCLGELIDPITIIGSSQMFNGVFRYMKSSEAKKLTILALENLERKIAMGEPPVSEKQLPPNASCSICTKSKSSNPFSSRRMRVCKICDAIVCKTCRVKKNILVGRQRVQSKVSVCQKCIAFTKSMTVNPADEKYVISREMQVGVDRNHAYSTASTAFETISNGRYNFSTRTAPGSVLSVDEASAYSSTSASGYSDEHSSYRTLPPAAAIGRDGPGLVLHAESYLESKAAAPTPTAATSQRPPPPPAAAAAPASASASAEPMSEQDALFAKMMALQESAKRAHDLTQASRTMMLETGSTPYKSG